MVCKGKTVYWLPQLLVFVERSMYLDCVKLIFIVYWVPHAFSVKYILGFTYIFNVVHHASYGYMEKCIYHGLGRKIKIWNGNYTDLWVYSSFGEFGGDGGDLAYSRDILGILDMNVTCQLDVFKHYCYPRAMYGAQAGIFKRSAR